MISEECEKLSWMSDSRLAHIVWSSILETWIWFMAFSRQMVKEKNPLDFMIIKIIKYNIKYILGEITLLIVSF